ncbi:MAG: methyl-accepting chemotaxis protein [Oscillospiraceae bacterium]|nr:methyl-accepting chemotaxis protein [Oscillospiraceae bacterium]
MKNLKVAKKLMLSFMIIAALTAVVGVTGIIGMRQIDTAFDDMYVNQTVPLVEIGKVVEMLQRQRACMREYIVGAATNDLALIEDAKNRVEEYRPVMYDNLETYEATIRDPEAKRLFEEAKNLYNNSFRECMDKIYDLAKEPGADPAALYTIMRDYTSDVNKITDNFDKCIAMKIDVAAAASDSASATADMLLMFIIVLLVAAIIVAFVLAFYISKIISNPLKSLTGFMKKAGQEGDINLTASDEQIISEYSKYKDETGECVAACGQFFRHVTEISEELQKISDGDLSAKITVESDKDVLGVSLSKTSDSLNNMFSEMNASASQVSIGSKQVADGAQSLAQGSTEQAASVQELSSSISEIAQKTKENAEMANRTSTLADSIRGSAEKGSQQMGEMTTAMNEINQASQSISKIINVINDISFQTNILALNAAVEAARAGQHGKGFAVVAEEVRNLATKSAEAAKDTETMIQDSIKKAELGARIAGETSTSLTEIVSGINESSQLIGDIAKSSEEQSLGISQINIGIDQVAQVVQQNSATAEESAAAAEEMSSQSAMLQELIAQFKLKNPTNSLLRSSSSSKRSAPEPDGHYSVSEKNNGYAISENISSGGKY